MRIERLRIENYRSIESDMIEFDCLTAFVGRNGAGKSTALNALSLFYNLSAHVSEFDYFDCDTKRSIKIQVTFSDLSEREAAEFGPYLSQGRLSVTKTISTGGSVYRGTRLQIPEFAQIRGMSFRPAQSEFRALVVSGRLPGLNGSPKSQSDLDQALEKFEADNPSFLRPIESDSQFLGPTNVGGGKLDNFTRFVRVPAIRDASDELDRKGAILQLIDVLILRSVNARPEVQALNATIESELRNIYSRQNLTELDSIAQSVTRILQRYAPGSSLDLDFAAVQAPKVPSPLPLASLIEDSFKCPIGNSGHGLQRALVFALLERLAYVEGVVGRGQEAVDSAEDPAPDLILAIEEPELFLHPSRERFIARTLRNLALGQTRPKTQICYTTHSPFFVGLDRFDQIRLTRKFPAEGTKTKRTLFSAFTRESASDALRNIAADVRSDFTSGSFVVRAAPVMTSTVNEGFFADAVVVVEGISDVAALSTIQELIGENWDEKGIVVVPAGGKANIDRPVVVFRGFRIPTFFVFDGDADATGDKRHQAEKMNRHLLRLAGAAEDSFPPTQIRETWAVFSKDIESEFRAVDPEFFDRVRGEIANEYGFAKVGQALKNPETFSLYARRAHQQGKLPAQLIDLVRQISRMADAVTESISDKLIDPDLSGIVDSGACTDDVYPVPAEVV